MSRVRGISQLMQGIIIEHVIPLFAISSLDHECYSGVKSRYLAGDAALVNCDLLQLSGLLHIEETRQRALGIQNNPPSTTITNRVSNTPTNPPLTGRPTPQPTQPLTQSSAVAYPPARGVPWKCIAVMMWEDKSCPGCHLNHPNDSPILKFHQEVGCPALAKHSYICQKDVTASSKVADKFNKKSPKMTDQAQTSKPVAKSLSDDLYSDQVSDMWVYSPSISNSTPDFTMPPAPIAKNVLLMPNQVAPTPTSNRYTDLYSLDSEDDQVFEELSVILKL